MTQTPTTTRTQTIFQNETEFRLFLMAVTGGDHGSPATIEQQRLAESLYQSFMALRYAQNAVRDRMREAQRIAQVNLDRLAAGQHLETGCMVEADRAIYSYKAATEAFKTLLYAAMINPEQVPFAWVLA